MATTGKQNPIHNGSELFKKLFENAQGTNTCAVVNPVIRRFFGICQPSVTTGSLQPEAVADISLYAGSGRDTFTDAWFSYSEFHDQHLLTLFNALDFPAPVFETSQPNQLAPIF